MSHKYVLSPALIAFLLTACGSPAPTLTLASVLPTATLALLPAATSTLIPPPARTMQTATSTPISIVTLPTTVTNLNTLCQAVPAAFAGKKSLYALDDRTAIAAGKQTYDNLCAACHGTSGKGDGPAAAALNPKPGNETDLTFMQTIPIECNFYLISEGIPPTGMPA